ncbi:30S ribosomal protein S6 [Metamycoplasma phocicerebrale]|uniref:Small ribosomal subunit protein bS6 n=1 Tax=Metamycoplasma phocicerebrale TaxID=142649 RepID=A0A3T0TTH3_9BACT|nr:30S ribosomal protein S6 [Metamycoplasma phocicerebrale]AZZ65276.1 30S ribosomal protein S6 [Metamycoplasma phocicerebrale]
MSNYEIMILVNPTSKEESVKELLFSVLNKENTKIERLERTELAYPINKLTHASYFLVLTKAEPSSLKELTRKLNIDKSILRTLIINLDSEKGLKPRKQKKFSRRNFDNKKPYVKSHNKENKETATEENKIEKKPKFTKKSVEKKEQD